MPFPAPIMVIKFERHCLSDIVIKKSDQTPAAREKMHDFVPIVEDFHPLVHAHAGRTPGASLEILPVAIFGDRTRWWGKIPVSFLGVGN